MASSEQNSISTSTCLVPYLDLNSSSGTAAALRGMPFRRNIFLLLGHSQGVFPPLMGVYMALFKGETRTLPLLDWQLVVLRIAALLDAEYEWDVNAPVAEVHGMGEERLEAVKAASDLIQDDQSAEGKVFDDRERVIIKIVDEQIATYNNVPATIEKARKLLSVEELVEIYIVLGVYTLIARITKGLHIDLDGEIPNLREHIRTGVTK
ncbi:MAG: hypothetical protein M1837_000968 [Sclerophora amabilis]|nr:MAG: hypothetical protein M1837_000968 [Sclerophora amabilis]